MKKTITTAILAATLTLSMGLTAFAGQWVNTGDWNWKWQNDDGTNPTSCWVWLDGNKDGIAECYYFGADGIMLHCNRSPDGYVVNHDGAWCEGGVVQTKAAK